MKLALLLAGTLLLAGSLHSAAEPAIVMRPLPDETKAVELSKEGPWGQLEYYQIPLACPDSLIPLINPPSQQTEWIFEAKTEEAVKDLLRDAGVTEEQIDTLFSGKVVVTDDRGLRLFPDDDLVLNMPAAVRGKVYSHLALSQHNRFYRRPVYIPDSNLSKWSRGTGLTPGVLQDIAKLAYPSPSGYGFFLSDVPYLMRKANNAVEERIILRALLSKRALVVRLRIDEDSDIEALADYWSSGYKHKDVLPMMKSILKSDAADSIELAHLLPPEPRMRLNTYPIPTDGLTGRYPDWFWTCYNFFRFTPREVYSDSEDRDNIIVSEFSPAIPPYQFGDLILIRSGQRLVHGCIFIADDIVYTKNGSDLFSPWILMKLNDVIAYHDMQGAAVHEVFRKR